MGSAAKIAAVTCLLFFLPALPFRGQGVPGSGLARSFQLPFSLSHGSLIVVKGSIGALHNLRFVLDTGTTQTIVDRRVVGRSRLPCHGKTTLINIDRVVRFARCILPSLGIGPFRMRDVKVSVGRLAGTSAFASGADAIIGMDVLGASRFTVDYPSRRVTFQRLERPSPAAAKNPDDPRCMTTVIDVQNHPVRLIVDTGARNILLYEDRLRRDLPDLRIEGKAESVMIGGRWPAERVVLPDVRLANGGTNRVALLISLPPNNSFPPDIDGYLGVSTLHARRITFDFIAKTLTWER